MEQSLSWIFYLLTMILPSILETIANWGRWSDMMVVKLPDIMSGSITIENILAIRVLEWLVILVGCKIKGSELEAIKSFVWLCWL